MLTSTNLLSWLCELVSPAVDPDHHATLNNVLKLSVGDTLYVSRRHAVPKVCVAFSNLFPFSRAQGGSTPLGRIRTRLSESAQNLGASNVISIVCCWLHRVSGDYVPPSYPHFLWVTEFPLFTRSDPDKEFLARGRWTSTHHPFTAPMWQDITAMYDGRIDQVCA